MQKINFQNLPSTATPINATNLNAIQSNVENVFNGNETMGNITTTGMTTNGIQTINTPNNVSSGLDIHAGTGNEASILYQNNDGTIKYAAGYRTYGFDGFGIYSAEKDRNVFQVDKDGNAEVLSDLLIGNYSLNQTLKTRLTGNRVGDGQTETFNVNGANGVYLFMNTHINQRCIVLLTLYNYSTVNVDVIYQSSPQAVPSFSLNNNTLTIVGAANCRGYLYLLSDMISA